MTSTFRFDYTPGAIAYGSECVADIEAQLAALDADRALLVTGQTVGNTPEVANPVEAGIGDRLAGVFDETTPEKRLTTALDAAARMRETDADALVSLGGGSSLDVAKVASVVAASDRQRSDVREEFERTGTVEIPQGEIAPVVAVPTTLAGADLSAAAGITARNDGLVRGGVFDGRLLPAALFYDPSLVATTPHEILCASAMNGFDKGVESLYASTATPMTDATATRGLTLLRDGLRRLGDGARDEETLHDAIVGTVLVQYGASRGDGTTLSLIHAFGHGIARGYAIQQGGAHGIIAPHALRYLFERVDGRRNLLADALGCDTSDPDATAAAVVRAVREVRDALGLPTRLRSVEDMSEDDLPEIARAVVEDGFMTNVPSGLDVARADIEAVLQKAW